MKQNPQAAFQSVGAHFANDPDVIAARMFGSDGLKTKGKVFAMLVKGSLVVKLPAARCAELVGSGAARTFDPGHGRPMKEWIQLAENMDDWVGLAAEAKAYVG